MKLNADIIYYHLSKTYADQMEYHRAVQKLEEIGRPRYFHTESFRPGYLYFVEDSDTLLAPGTYFCTARPKLSNPYNSSWFLFRESVRMEDLYNELQEIFDLYDEWENACIRMVTYFRDYQELLVQTYKRLGTPLCLMDHQFSIVASVQDPASPFLFFGEDGQLSLEAANYLIGNPFLQNMEYKSGIFDFDYDCNYKMYNFQSRGKYCGRLIVGVQDARFRDRDALILEHLSKFVEILVNRFGSFQPTSSLQSRLHTFFSQSLNGNHPRAVDLHRLELNTGWLAGHFYMLLYFLPEHRLKKDLYPPYLVSQIEERWRDCCAVEYQGNVAMLLNVTLYGENKLSDFYQSLAYLVRDGLMIAGCSRIFPGMRDLNLYFQQAQFAIEFGQKNDVTRWYFRFDDYALSYLLNYGTGVFKPEQVCHPALLRLKEHDQNRQTCFYETLYTFFQSKFNMSHAAKALFIHRSTFITRMERIEELTGIDLDNYDVRLYLELSFRLLEAGDRELTFQFRG